MDAEGELDLRSLMLALWSKRWWIIASMILFTGAFTSTAFLMTPVYRVTSVLTPATERTGTGSLGSALAQFGGLASLAGVSLGSGGSDVEESLAVMRSRQFTESFIRERNLMPVLFPKQWDAATRRWKGKKENWPTLAQASKYFDTHVRTATQDKKTGLVTVQIEWRDPNEAAEWCNDLVARLNAEMRARAIAKSGASVAYLQKELAATAVVETRQAISRLLESQINQRMYANVTEDYALRVVDKALPPDRGDVVRPKKLLMLVAGPALGFAFGAFVAILASTLFPATRAVGASNGRQ